MRRTQRRFSRLLILLTQRGRSLFVADARMYPSYEA